MKKQLSETLKKLMDHHPRDKAQIVNDNVGKLANAGSDASSDISNAFATSIMSRRGMFTGVMTLCGLGIMSKVAKAHGLDIVESILDPASLTPQRKRGIEFSLRGEPVTAHWFTKGGGSNGGIAYNGRAVGYCNPWQAEWPSSMYTWVGARQRLRCALGMEVGCNYSNELYNLMYAMPLMACGDMNEQARKRMWFTWEQDNWGSLYQDGAQISTFTGNLIDEDLGTDRGTRNVWYDTDYKSYMEFYGRTSPHFFIRRAVSNSQHKYTASVGVSNVRAPFDPRSANDPYHDKYVRYPPDMYTTLWLGVDIYQTQQSVAIKNKTDLDGLIVKISAYESTAQSVDVDSGKQGEGIAVRMWKYANSTHQNFMINPAGAIREDNRFAHVLSVLSSKALVGCLNQDGADAPHMDSAGNAIMNSGVHQHSYDSTLACHWWIVDHNGQIYMFCDGSGHVLNRKNGVAADRGDVWANSTGYTNQWDDYASRWKIEEVQYQGKLKLPDKCVYPAKLVCPNPALTCTPYDNAKTGSVSYRYKWYMTDAKIDVTDDKAVVYAQAHMSEYGDMPEILAHGHVGMSQIFGYQMESVRFRLAKSSYTGSINYSIRTPSGKWVTAKDGGWCGQKSVSNRITAMKVWLTGEIARHYEIDLRLFYETSAWTKHFYLHDANDIASDNTGHPLRGLCLRLLRKPTDAVALTSFSTSNTYQPQVNQNNKFVYCSTELAIDNVPSTNTLISTDRYNRQVISGGCLIKAIGHVSFYVDGQKEPVYRSSDYDINTTYTIPDDARKAGAKDYCNVSKNYNAKSSTGFIYWFSDEELTHKVGSSVVITPGEIKLYGRNRATLKLDYAETSIKPEKDGDYRTGPNDDSPKSNELDLPTLSEAKTHIMTGSDGKPHTLPAIHDVGCSYVTAYYGETVDLPKRDKTYQRLPNGTWRTITVSAWLPDAHGQGNPSLKHIMKRDASRYVAWIELTADGIIDNRYNLNTDKR